MEKYPKRVKSERVQFDKRFVTESGNEELCHHTGYERIDGPELGNTWFEYEDRYGELHYGR